MAPAASDNDAADVGMHPERKQPPPVSSSATVTSESNGSESDTDEEVFKLEMKLLWAERKCIDLDRTNQEERKARVAVEAQLRALQSNGSDLTIAVSEAEELRATVQALEITVGRKDAEVLVVQSAAITAVQDADSSRVQLRTSQVENRRLENKVDTLERALSDANIRSSSSSISQAVINELQIRIGSQQTQIDQHVRDSSRSMANAERLQEKVDSQRQELDDVQERLNVAEAARDRYVLHYTYYTTLFSALQNIFMEPGRLQCIVAGSGNFTNVIVGSVQKMRRCRRVTMPTLPGIRDPLTVSRARPSSQTTRSSSSRISSLILGGMPLTM
jgi:hypothetical protein